MKDTLLKLVTPFKGLTPNERRLSNTVLILLLFSLWSLSQNKYLPPPLEIIKAFPNLIASRDLFFNFQKSLFFCFKAIAYSSAISLFFCYLSVIPLFETLCEFLRKFRFLPSAGLSFFFIKVTGGDIEKQMLWMMVFGVTTWLLDSMIGIALSITPEEKMYAKSLRLTRWQMMRELLIYGKAADNFEAVIGNFAMAWMLLASIENIAKASGGIGVILSESNKYYKFEEVYAIQFMILITGNLLDYSLRKIKGWIFPYTNLICS